VPCEMHPLNRQRRASFLWGHFLEMVYSGVGSAEEDQEEKAVLYEQP